MLPNYTKSQHITELYSVIITCRIIFSHRFHLQQYLQVVYLTTGVIISPRCNKSPRHWKKVQKRFLEKVSNCRKITNSLSLRFTEHTCLVLEAEKTSAVCNNWAQKHSNFFSQSESSAKKLFNFLSQSEPSITSPESSANQNRLLRHPSCQPIRIKYYVPCELSAMVEDPSRFSAPLGSL